MKIKSLSGADAAGEAMRQINPDVAPVYPITPQTPIMHKFAQFVADGEVKTEMIRVESEHSAMSAAIGSCAAGARTMTATSSQGLALMIEIVLIAPPMRLPIVMNLVNRALSGPINIHCDHSDGMLARDSGWIQLYSEDAQEVYDNNMIALRLAEEENVRLPVMVCQDGFVTSHEVMRVEVQEDAEIGKFIREFKPEHPLLDTEHPITYGAIDMFDYYFEHKRQQVEALTFVFEAFSRISEEYSRICGRKLDLIEGYRLEDAEIAVVCLNSAAGSTKYIVDELRGRGIKAGLLKIRMFRPFPKVQIMEALKGLKAFAVLDRAESFSLQGGPLFIDVRSSFYGSRNQPKTIDYVYGLGGRELTLEHIRKVFAELEEIKGKEDYDYIRYLGVRQ
jgi:pyruvate ferredoxin oxidoreductase alpha subunit